MNYYKLYITLIVTYFFHYYSNGQNLIPNSGFEDNSGFPVAPGQWSLCNDWNNVNNYQWFQWPYGSPDYVHVKGEGGLKLPFSTFGETYPNGGEAAMGFVLWADGIKNYREYLSTKLVRPLQIGGRYQIEFYLTNGIQTLRGGSGIENFGINFSKEPLYQEEHEVIEVEPQLEFDSIYFDTDWNKITMEFIANENFGVVTFGNFRDDSNTIYQEYSEVGFKSAYYFIDDISIKQKLSIVTTPSRTICEGDEVILTALGGNNLKWTENNPYGEVIYTERVLTARPMKSTTYYLLTENDTISLHVYVQSKPVVDEVIDTNFCYSNPLRLQAGVRSAEYLWNDESSDRNLYVNTTGTYSVLIKDLYCSLEQHFIVNKCECREEFLYPNTITPNGDGYNDVFKPIVMDQRCIRTAHLNIYNRWGTRIYSGENMKFDWDGKGVTDGTYFYGLNCQFKNGKEKVIKGSLIVLK